MPDASTSSIKFRLRIEAIGIDKPPWAGTYRAQNPDASIVLVRSQANSFEHVSIPDAFVSECTSHLLVVKDHWVILPELGLKPSLVVGAEPSDIPAVAEAVAALVLPRSVLIGMAFGDVLRLAGSCQGKAEGRSSVYRGLLTSSMAASIGSDLRMLASAGWGRGSLIVQLAHEADFQLFDLRQADDLMREATQQARSKTLWTVTPTDGESNVIVIAFHDLVEIE